MDKYIWSMLMDFDIYKDDIELLKNQKMTKKKFGDKYNLILGSSKISKILTHFNISSRTYVCGKKGSGYLYPLSKDFWSNIHDYYVSGNSIIDTVNFYGLDISKEKLRVLFKELDFSIRDGNSEVSKELRYRKYKDTCLKKYGVVNLFQDEGVKNKIKKTNILKYGAENPSQNKEILELKKLTWLRNYGSDNPSKSDIIKQKKIETCRTNYGVDYPMESKTVVHKVRKTKINNHYSGLLPRLEQDGYELLDTYHGIMGTEYYSKNNEHYIKYRIKHKECGTIFEKSLLHIPKCPVCFKPVWGRSKPEIKLDDFIQSLGYRTQHGVIVGVKNQNNRPINFDIIIPDLKIVFEYNGLLYHACSTGFNKSTVKDNKFYHTDKQTSALNNGYKLYWIWENHHNPTIIQSIIKNILKKPDKKYHARKLVFKKITDKQGKANARIFLELNHLKSLNNLDKYFYGLFENDVLISLMTFRDLGNKSVELSRFCSIINSQVMGGFSKLLKNSIVDLKSKGYCKIMTYADRDLSPDVKDTVYFKNGFKYIGDTGPSLFYTDVYETFSRQKFQKHKLKKILLEKYDDNLTEQQMLSMINIYPCYTSGNWKFELEIN